MGSMTTAQTAAALATLGWRRPRSTGELAQSVRRFQDLWLLGTPLAVDGTVGPATSRAIRESLARRSGGHPTMSPHFSASELACHCRGAYSACTLIWTPRHALEALERLRSEHYPRGLSLISACRCLGQNTHVGGAKSSRHMAGDAFDIAPVVPWRVVAAMGIYGGIGINANGCARHVDQRSGSPRSPATWRYPG